MLPVCCRPLSNTGQGRRRLNARAALRAAGQDKQTHIGPVATSPQPHLPPTAMSSLAARQPSLDNVESSSSRKCKAMAGAYSSTYRKLQAQGQLHQPSMQLTLAEAAAMDRQELLPSGKPRQACCVYILASSRVPVWSLYWCECMAVCSVQFYMHFTTVMSKGLASYCHCRAKLLRRLPSCQKLSSVL